MSRALSLIFAVVAYAIFFATFLYLVVFVGDLQGAPITVDRGGASSPMGAAIAVDLTLIALFGLQHSGMARRAFKRWWTRLVPEHIERSIYVLTASLVLILLFLVWQPIPAVIWSTDGIAATAIWALFGLGWAVVLLSTFLINHFELFGLQQAWFKFRGRQAADPQFRTPFLYRLVRHPLYLGFCISFFAAPTMTIGRLVFALGMTSWILIAIGLEEQDLIAMFGDRYRDYRKKVGKLVPLLGRG
jgi:protein-S-isoprenylcysteine O-methyltransferase Ste14